MKNINFNCCMCCVICCVLGFALGWVGSNYYNTNKKEHYAVYRGWRGYGNNGVAGGQTVAASDGYGYARVGRFGAESADGSKAGGCRYGTVTGPYNTAGRGCCVTRDGSDYKAKCCRKLNGSGGCAVWE